MRTKLHLTIIHAMAKTFTSSFSPFTLAAYPKREIKTFPIEKLFVE